MMTAHTTLGTRTMLDRDEFEAYLDQWMADSGRLQHGTVIEIITDAFEEFEGNKRSFDEWLVEPMV